jgi:hypothetical protein
MRLILIASLVFAFSSPAFADDWASVAFTGGAGRLEIVTDYWIFSSGKSYEAQIPRRILEGTRIRIYYKKDGHVVEADFDVAGISTKGELCRIHNKFPSRYSTEVGDTIYVKPCRYQ